MRSVWIAVGVACFCLVWVAQAAASPQEIGDRCVGNDSEAGWTAIVLNNGISFYPELPPEVPPEGQKVITRWKVQVGPGLGPVAQQLVAFRQVGEEEDQLVAESAVETLVEGTNEFRTRMVVPEYAHIGLRGPSQTLFCDHAEGHLGGVVTDPWTLGETQRFHVETELGVPVLAFVEPDRDRDGHGDESEDLCPQSALYQGPCPTVTLSHSVTVKPSALLVAVSSTAEAPVKVFGQVAWKVRQPGPRRRLRGLIAGLAGGEQTVVPGAAAYFRVPLASSVRRRLGRIAPPRHLTARLTLQATDLAGNLTQSSFAVRLPGREKPPGR